MGQISDFEEQFEVPVLVFQLELQISDSITEDMFQKHFLTISQKVKGIVVSRDSEVHL